MPWRSSEASVKLLYILCTLPSQLRGQRHPSAQGSPAFLHKVLESGTFHLGVRCMTAELRDVFRVVGDTPLTSQLMEHV